MQAAGADRADEAASVGALLALLDALPASVALWDKDVRLRYGNHRALTRFGRPPAALLGVHLSELVQPQAVELSAQYIDGALAGIPQQVERAMVDPHGQRYNAHQVTHIPNVVDGVVTGYCALAVDITASLEGYEIARRAREQAALQAERDRIAGDIGSHRVVDDLSAALKRLDAAVDRAADALPDLNPAADAIERSIEELRETMSARMHGEPNRLGALAAFPGMAVPFDMESVASSPGVRWPPGITGSGWSVAELRALLDLLPAAVAVWGPTLDNRYANRAAVRWFGHSDRAEVLGRPAGELLGPGVFEANRPYAEAALAGEPQQIDRTIAHASGLRHVQASYVPLLRDGVIEGVCSFVVDVTPRVEAELALQDARAELATARERERIADDLHNLVIQRLFAASLAASLPAVTEAQVRSVQDGIMAALADLESAMTSLHEHVELLDLLPELAHLVHDTTRGTGITATIENVGSVEYIPPGVGTELLAAAEAAVTAIAADSDAGDVVVTIAADAAGVWLRVVADGPSRALGPDEGAMAGGLAELVARAERLGGSCSWRGGERSGPVIDWRVPTSR